MSDDFTIRDLNDRDEITVRRIVQALGKLTKHLSDTPSEWKTQKMDNPLFSYVPYVYYCNPLDEAVSDLAYDMSASRQVLEQEFKSPSFHHAYIDFNSNGFKLTVHLAWNRSKGEEKKPEEKTMQQELFGSDVKFGLRFQEQPELEEYPRCDFCDKEAHYDAKTKMGPWAYCCEDHFKERGMGLGLGKGQLITIKKQGTVEGRKVKEDEPVMNIEDYGVRKDKKVKVSMRGGLAEGHSEDEFDPEQIKMGMGVEKEHTDDPELAKEIVMDHLVEIPDYYTRLKKMEDEAKKEMGKKESKLAVSLQRGNAYVIKYLDKNQISDDPQVNDIMRDTSLSHDAKAEAIRGRVIALLQEMPEESVQIKTTDWTDSEIDMNDIYLAMEEIQEILDIDRELGASKKTAGTWSLPTTLEKMMELHSICQDLGQKGDAKIAVEGLTSKLYNVLGSDELFDQLEERGDELLASVAQQIIRDYLKLVIDLYQEMPDSFKNTFEPRALDYYSETWDVPLKSQVTKTGGKTTSDTVYEMGVAAGEMDKWVAPSSDGVGIQMEDLARKTKIKDPQELVNRWLDGWENTDSWKKEYQRRIDYMRTDDFAVAPGMTDLVETFESGFVQGLKNRGINILEVAQAVIKESSETGEGE